MACRDCTELRKRIARTIMGYVKLDCSETIEHLVEMLEAIAEDLSIDDHNEVCLLRMDRPDADHCTCGFKDPALRRLGSTA